MTFFPAQLSYSRTPRRLTAPAHVDRPRFLSEADCHDIAERLARFSTGGGYTAVSIVSTWVGNVRWARNHINTSGEVRDNTINVLRNIRGAIGTAVINDTTGTALVAAARRAERLAQLQPEKPNSDLVTRLPLEPAAAPSLFSDATYQMDAGQREAVVSTLTQQAAAVGMLSAGYIEVAAVGMGVLDSFGRARYFTYTQAQCSMTVRDSQGTGSGWAGLDWYDWNKIDATHLSQIALDKCLKSRNPVTVEPGRYTTILEPQAVCDLVGQLIYGSGGDAIDRTVNESRNNTPRGPFFKRAGVGDAPDYSKLGDRVMDERITMSADPMDPEIGFPPFSVHNYGGYDEDQFVIPVYHPVTWIDHGVLTHLAYDRGYALAYLTQNTGLPNSGAFRMTGGETSVAEMIKTTKRGLLVTRLDRVIILDRTSQLYRGYTRDGLWLIENGAISKPVKNMAFTESILFVLNNIEQLGPPQRVFNPCVALEAQIPQPVIVPPLKIRDFSFTALVDAV